MYHQFSSYNPFRSLHWRWERAGLMAENVLPLSRKRDTDAKVLRAARFRKKLQECNTQLDTTVVAELEPALYWAHDVWQVPKEGPYTGGVKYEMEARILAGLSDDAIAERQGLPEDLVTAYADYFFDVRPKLNNQSYILQRVLGPAIRRGLNTRDYDLLWKLFGYMRGVHTLEYAILGWTTSRCVIPEGDVERIWAQDQAQAFKQLAQYTTRSFKVHSENQRDVLELYHDLLKMEQAAGQVIGGVNDAMTNSVRAFLDINAYRCGPPAATEEPTLVLEYDRGDIELPAIDLARCAAGEPPELDPRVATLRFPDQVAIEGPSR